MKNKADKELILLFSYIIQLTLETTTLFAQ